MCNVFKKLFGRKAESADETVHTDTTPSTGHTKFSVGDLVMIYCPSNGVAERVGVVRFRNADGYLVETRKFVEGKKEKEYVFVTEDKLEAW